jgi:large subunit ribosomal protein L5
VKEQTIFPEIDANHTGAIQGMDITFVTTGKTDAEARELLKLLGIPFSSK